MDRTEIKNLVSDSFKKMFENDYCFKFTENEEDERAATYRYMRNDLEAKGIVNIRVFLSYTFSRDGKTFKPDILICSHSGDKKNVKNINAEALVEMKNWPNKDEIKRDLDKLINYRKRLELDNPLLFFCGILDKDIKKNQIEHYKNELAALKPEYSHIEIILFTHSGSYVGPWNSKKKTDPWREKFRK